MNNVLRAFIVVTLAGLCTALGGTVVFLRRIVYVANPKALAVALGLSSGVMIFVSLAELLPESMEALQASSLSGDHRNGQVYAVAIASFFGGIIIMAMLDRVAHFCGGHVDMEPELLDTFRHNQRKDDQAARARAQELAQAGRRDATVVTVDVPDDLGSRDAEEEEEEEEEEQMQDQAEEKEQLPVGAVAIATAVPTVACEAAEVGPNVSTGRTQEWQGSEGSVSGGGSEAAEVDEEVGAGKDAAGAVVTVTTNNEPARIVARSAARPVSATASDASTADDAEEAAASPDCVISVPDRFASPDAGGAATDEAAPGRVQSRGRLAWEKRVMLNTPSSSLRSIDTQQQQRLEHVGVMSALAIALHNFPEGLVTFLVTMADFKAGIGLAVAITVHNIPEGVCVAVPVYYATGKPWKGFMFAAIAGLAEPAGALVGWLILHRVFTELARGIVMAAVAGMMVFICVHEVLPTAYRFDRRNRYVPPSVLAGMAVMAVSLALFAL